MDPLVAILERHQCKVEPSNGDSQFVSFPRDELDFKIGEYGSIHLKDDDAVEFGIERPRYQDEFYSLSFELIKELNVSMVISSGDEAFVAKAESIAELPYSLASVATVVHCLGDLATG